MENEITPEEKADLDYYKTEEASKRADEEIEYNLMEKRNRLWLKSEKLGVAGNIELAEYVETLEERIERLEQRLSDLSRSTIGSQIIRR